MPAKIKTFFSKNKKLTLKITSLLITTASLLLFFWTSLIPFYISNKIDTFIIFEHINFNANPFKYIDNIVIFCIFWILFFILLFFYIPTLFSIKKDDQFYRRSKLFNILQLISLGFFSLGSFLFCIIYNFIAKQNIYNSNNIGFFIASLVLFFVHFYVLNSFSSSYLNINNFKQMEKEDIDKQKTNLLEGFIYTFLITIVSFISIFIVFLNIQVTIYINDVASYSDLIILNPLNLLTNYKTLDASSQVITFAFIVFYIIIGCLFSLSFVSFIRKYKNVRTLYKLTTYTNVFFIFLFSITGLYFSIAQQFNKEYIEQLLISLNYDISKLNFSYDYIIKTDFFYLFIAEFVILLVCLIRKIFENKNEEVSSNDVLTLEDDSTIKQENDYAQLLQGLDNISNKIIANLSHKEEVKANNIDPCESFTNFESKIPSYESIYENDLAKSFKDINLINLVQFIVDYAKNSPEHLSYTKETIASFVSGLGFSKLTILQGISGTGKTSLPKIFTKAILGETRILEVESSWKDKNELIGYFNQFSKKFIPTKFTNSLYEASLNPHIIYFIVLDEMNLSRIEYYFSDFLSLMENEENKRILNLVNIPLNRYEDGKLVNYKSLLENQYFPIPKNIYFIGTANNDESIFDISDKVYDRASILDFNKRNKKVRNISSKLDERFISYQTLNKLFIDAIESSDFDAEQYPLIISTEEILSKYNITFGNRILKQIEEFVAIYNKCFEDDRTKEAVEQILLTKVVSKLRNKIIEDKEELVEKFKKLSLLKISSYIEKLNEE